MKSKTVYMDQSALGLNLNVVSGSLNLRQFHVLSEKSILRHHVQIESKIIGASHLVLFILGKLYIYEVLACTEVVTPSPRLFFGNLGGMSSHLELTFPDVARYSFDYQLMTYEKGLKKLVILEEEVTKCTTDSKTGLVFNFPIDPISHIVPRTVLITHLDDANNLIIVNSAHSYPNEKNIVFSETKIQILKNKQELIGDCVEHVDHLLES